MIDLRRAAHPALVLVALLLMSVLGACSGAATDATASATPPQPTQSDPPSPAVSPEAAIDPATPTACLNLGPRDCERARALAVTTLTADDPVPQYIQVGPFGCAAGERCPSTLVARPEGDVVIEFPGGQGINVHVKVAADGSFTATREPAMGVAVEPASAGPIAAGPSEFTLGHCGVLGGIDLGGSWWDPVGPVPMDSGDAVNATAGIVVVSDPDHATFTAPSGFALQLLRRDGPKLLPFCM